MAQTFINPEAYSRTVQSFPTREDFLRSPYRGLMATYAPGEEQPLPEFIHWVFDEESDGSLVNLATLKYKVIDEEFQKFDEGDDESQRLLGDLIVTAQDPQVKWRILSGAMSRSEEVLGFLGTSLSNPNIDNKDPNLVSRLKLESTRLLEYTSLHNKSKTQELTPEELFRMEVIHCYFDSSYLLARIQGISKQIFNNLRLDSNTAYAESLRVYCKLKTVNKFREYFKGNMELTETDFVEATMHDVDNVLNKVTVRREFDPTYRKYMPSVGLETQPNDQPGSKIITDGDKTSMIRMEPGDRLDYYSIMDKLGLIPSHDNIYEYALPPSHSLELQTRILLELSKAGFLRARKSINNTSFINYQINLGGIAGGEPGDVHNFSTKGRFGQPLILSLAMLASGKGGYASALKNIEKTGWFIKGPVLTRRKLKEPTDDVKAKDAAQNMAGDEEVVTEFRLYEYTNDVDSAKTLILTDQLGAAIKAFQKEPEQRDAVEQELSEVWISFESEVKELFDELGIELYQDWDKESFAEFQAALAKNNVETAMLAGDVLAAKIRARVSVLDSVFADVYDELTEQTTVEEKPKVETPMALRFYESILDHGQKVKVIIDNAVVAQAA